MYLETEYDKMIGALNHKNKFQINLCHYEEMLK